MTHTPKNPLPALGLSSPATEVLSGALDHFSGRIVIATSLGPQTLAILHMLHQLKRKVPIVLLDTGLLFDETYRLKEQIERLYGHQIQAIHPLQTVPQQAQTHGEALWSHNSSLCCQLRKVHPLNTVLQPYDAWITGLRRDQSDGRADTLPVDWDEQHRMWKISPMAAWTRDEVFEYLESNGVPYNPLINQGYRSVGCKPCTHAVTIDHNPDDERAGRWRGHDKTECGIHFLFDNVEPKAD